MGVRAAPPGSSQGQIVPISRPQHLVVQDRTYHFLSPEVTIEIFIMAYAKNTELAEELRRTVAAANPDRENSTMSCVASFWQRANRVMPTRSGEYPARDRTSSAIRSTRLPIAIVTLRGNRVQRRVHEPRFVVRIYGQASFWAPSSFRQFPLWEQNLSLSVDALWATGSGCGATRAVAT